MKLRIISVASGVMILATLVVSLNVLAQDEAAKTKNKITTPTMRCCPGCPMGGTPRTMGAGKTASSQEMMKQCMNMMQKAGITPEMMQRCQVMTQTPIFLDSPSAIYGQGDVLELSNEQKEKLIAIQNEARKKALAVLTAEQRKKMGDIPDKPIAMAQMCQQMCSKMMGGEGKVGPMMMCPMMSPWMKGAPEKKDK